MTELWKAQQNLIQLTRSQITESLIWLDGKKISLKDYPMHRAFYDGGYPKTLLKTCRQVAKSTTLACFDVTESIAQPYFKTLFFSPTQEQTNKFSSLRVGKILTYSPLINKLWVGENRILSRNYLNGSENAFSYALDDGDRLRGISADRILADEVQDILLDEVLPVARECLSASDYRYETYCGTPKTLDNPIESLWQNSTKSEWFMQCTSCNNWNYIDTEKNFQVKGPICLKCEGLLNPRNGQWIDLNPGAEIKGFHISQAIMPKNVPACWDPGTDRHTIAVNRWREIMLKLNGPKPYPISIFRNEVIGVSDSQGTRLVTKEDLLSLCIGPETMPMSPDKKHLYGITKIAAGIDWSGGGKDMVSHTVLCIWGLTANKVMRCLYLQIFVGEHPLEELKKIKNILAFYQPEMICCDAGEGNLHTEELRRLTGWTHKIQKICYGSGVSPVKWNSEGYHYSVNRTKAIDSFMMSVLRKEYVFCRNKNLMAVAFEHILAEFITTTRLGRKVWRHSHSDPDDALHAMIFGRLAMQIICGEIDMTA